MALLDHSEPSDGAVVGETAPLVRLPGAPSPKVGAAEWFTGAGGAKLRAALFPAAKPIGSVVISSGRTEFIEKYLEVGAELVELGYTVLIHDWRGQGLSQRLLQDRLVGHAEGYDDFVADHSALLDAFASRLPKPWFSLSHSMGGCLTMLALAKGETRYAAAIFSAPMLGIAGFSPWLGRMIGGTMRVLGRSNAYGLGGSADPYTTTFEGDSLTHDRARYDRTRAYILADRDLALGAVTWGWIRSAFDSVHWLQTSREVTLIKTPIAILGAAQEKLVDNAGQRIVAGRVPGARYVEIAGSFHEILMETDDIRAQFWAEFEALVARA